MTVVITAILFLIVVILALALNKIDKKEGYCVDISGGFKADCDCNGYCEIRS